jgi:23S rRNA (cytidine2498-2'-O)-methyltransferase
MSPRFIAVATRELHRSALQELSAVAPGLRLACYLERGTFMVECDPRDCNIGEALARSDPVFVKHIMPVQVEFELARRRAVDLPAILAAVQAAGDAGGLPPAGAEFSVQCRRTGRGYDYDAKDVEVCVGEALEARGAVPVFSDLECVAEDWHRVVSVYLFEGRGYAGISSARDNLNEHCDEERIFARRARDVCRAEFKLLEALRKFRLTRSLPRGRALDLGAAPGGWTKVLADTGMAQVVAVDPADLDPKVARLANVTHARRLDEVYAEGGLFDLLVNDMNVGPEPSARVMAGVAPRVRPGAFAIMTAKLVQRNPVGVINDMLPILQSGYEILRVKNLFHNRLEVTLLLRRRAE